LSLESFSEKILFLPMRPGSNDENIELGILNDIQNPLPETDVRDRLLNGKLMDEHSHLTVIEP
jgi:hypothetical protein